MEYASLSKIGVDSTTAGAQAEIFRIEESLRNHGCPAKTSSNSLAMLRLNSAVEIPRRRRYVFAGFPVCRSCHSEKVSPAPPARRGEEEEATAKGPIDDAGVSSAAGRFRRILDRADSDGAAESLFL